jgi:MoxR-like ATPase
MNEEIKNFIQSIDQIIVGKTESIKLSLACFFARGHLLIEDHPGVGKTTLAKAIAKGLGLPMSRIQLTNDLMPADLVGLNIFDQKKSEYHFLPGPLFSEIILADELNRASPRTQSALLQAMEERQITIEGKTHTLPENFFVIATQNPKGQIGTFPLPESQLDRFMMRLQLGHPEQSFEMNLLQGNNRATMIEKMSPLLDHKKIKTIKEKISQIHLSPAIAGHIVLILKTSRSETNYAPLSSRAGIDLAKAAKAWAYFERRDFVLPDDIQYLAPFVLGHRLHPLGQRPVLEGQRLSQQLLATLEIV